MRITFGHHHEVQVDSDNRAHLTNVESYHDTVKMDTTWAATMKYAESLKRNNTKIAFFNSTPQGGGVALMRHALIRFLRLIGVDCTWYAAPRGYQSLANTLLGMFRMEGQKYFASPRIITISCKVSPYTENV